jgi:phage terminase small subunit
VSVLTPKQEQFVVEYLKDLNATQAAARAGYSEHSAKDLGGQLLANPKVRAAIDAAKAGRVERTKIDADYVLAGIQRVTERCEQAEPVYDAEGRATGEYRFEAGNALRGYELLGKHLAMFKDRLEISDLREKSEAELEAEDQELAQQLAKDASDLV